MANLCFNKLIIRGEHKEIEKFLEKIAGDETLFDFDKVLPVPEELYKVLNVDTLQDDMLNIKLEEDGYTLPADVTKHFDTNLPYGEGTFRDNAVLAIKCAEKYGSPCWAYWCVEHWGVKRNAKDTKIRWRKPCCCYLSFTTEWDPPNGVIQKVVSMYPKLSFELKRKMEHPIMTPNSIDLGNGKFITMLAFGNRILTEEEKEGIKQAYLSKDPNVSCTFDRPPK